MSIPKFFHADKASEHFGEGLQMKQSASLALEQAGVKISDPPIPKHFPNIPWRKYKFVFYNSGEEL